MQITRRIVKVLKKTRGRPVTVNELAADSSLKRVRREELKRVLETLAAEGRVKAGKQGYSLVEFLRVWRGLFQASPHGYGFVVIPEGDIFIPAGKVRGAMHGDEVEARQIRRRGPGGRIAGEIVKIVKRANKRVVGRFEKKFRLATVTPVNKRLPYEILIRPQLGMSASTGDIVVAEIDIWPENRQLPQGHVIEIIGRENEPGVDIETVIHSHELATDFSRKALAEAEKISEEISSTEFDRRRDLRELFTVTIDGLDAKDFDDAVSLDIDQRGFFHLWIHIADVSHYVSFGSPLDEDALYRGTSVYLPDRVLSMLPPKLSNHICSLNPLVDRLAFSVFMKVDPNGEVADFEMAESVINSNYRLTYEEVDGYLASDRFPGEDLERLLKSLNLLSGVLSEKRLARGSLEFETIEPKIVLNERLWPVEIQVRERTPATQIIEEAMILTNETVAEFMWRTQAPMIYRVHERPDPEAVIAVSELLKGLGYPIGSLAEAHPRTFQALIDFAHNRPERLLINSLLLRAMRQARYSELLESHFGLAAEHYTHFTSPIRRYPDLMVHRLVKAKLREELGEARTLRMIDDLGGLAKHCSIREREAEEAEREAVEVKICQYMTGRIGEVYEAVISGVSTFGFFVELPNSAEGLVHIRSLEDDYYRFEAPRYLLKGERTGKTYRLGQHVRVKLINVSIAKRELDFVLVGEEGG